jgi:hypothetical protein
MRPLGHDGARAEREERIAPVNARLQEAWDRYRSKRAYPYNDYFDVLIAAAFLDSVRPSIHDLHHLIITSDVRGRRAHLGPFVTAGYQLQREEEIVYDLDTPDLHRIGTFLIGKRLIINGTLGDNVGQRMIGDLIVNGRVGGCAGQFMVGNLHLPGSCGDHTGRRMHGTITTYGHLDAGEEMMGEKDGVWTMPRDSMPVPSERSRRQFLEDIRNPQGRDNHALRRHLAYQYTERNS